MIHIHSIDRRKRDKKKISCFLEMKVTYYHTENSANGKRNLKYPSLLNKYSISKYMIKLVKSSFYY